MRWEVGRTRERPCRDAGQYRACLFRDLEDNWSGLPQPHASFESHGGSQYNHICTPTFSPTFSASFIRRFSTYNSIPRYQRTF